MDRYLFPFKTNRGYTPKDSIVYIIPEGVIRATEKVLTEYASNDPPHEGLVYWGGTKKGHVITVSMAIAPETDSNYGRVSTSNISNFYVVRALNKDKLVEVAQVHSHPTDWVGHSPGDDELAPFKVAGLLSIVAPTYCLDGMRPLTICGVHRYSNYDFVRLSEKYIRAHFKIVKDMESKFVDLRK